MPNTTTPAFQEALATYREAIDKALAEYFDSSQAQFGLDLQKHELEAFGHLREFSLRPGKRLRGILTLLSYKTFSNKPSQSIINAAIAIEMAQNYLLIIDDVMDRSDERRGQPTVHRLLEKKLEHKDAGWMGGMLAINIGLLGSHLATNALSRVEEQPKRVVQALELFNSNIGATGYGQIDDLYNNLLTNSTEEEVIRLYELKDSYYSFINPLQIGAVLAGRGEREVLEELKNIGLPAGVAYQLQDDILGLFGDEEVTGKSTIDDLREGKFTMLILYALARADSGGRQKIREALGNPQLSVEQHRAVQSIIKDCGALAAVRAKAEEYAKLAQERIDSSTILDSSAKEFMTELLKFTITRKV